VTGQGYVTASSEQQTLDNVLGQGNTSSNSMSVGAISGSALDVSGDVDVTGSINVGSFTTATSSTDSYTQFDKIVLDNKFNTAANGPNRIVLHDNNAWKAGFGIHSSTHAAYSGADFAWYKTSSGPTYTQYMILNSSGNVGIGVTNPSYRLDVSGDSTSGVIAVRNAANGRDTFRSENTSGVRTFNIGNDANGHGLVLVRGAGGTTTSQIAGNGDTYFDTDTLYIDHSTNNVGIGTTSPDQKLEVASGHILVSNNYDYRGTDTGGNERTLVRINSNNEAEYGSSLAGPVKFMGGGSYTERMRIHTNGNIGIGTTSPDSKLHVQGALLLQVKCI
jgi:hypothetical protein